MADARGWRSNWGSCGHDCGRRYRRSSVEFEVLGPVRLRPPPLRPRGEPSGPALDIRTLLEKVRPSVVTIRTDPGLAAGTGSGIVVDEQGTVLTNAHVINAATEIEIEFSNGDLRPAVLVGSFPEHDVALVEFEDLASQCRRNWATPQLFKLATMLSLSATR